MDEFLRDDQPEDHEEVPRRVHETFSVPFNTIEEQDNFNERDMGLTHPDNNSFIKLKQNGDIEIVADGSLSIVMSPSSQSITFVADHIKFITKHESGMRWNKLAFNDKAIHYNEPTFISIDDEQDGYGLYDGVDYYMDEEDIESSSNESTDLISDAVNRIGNNDD